MVVIAHDRIIEITLCALSRSGIATLAHGWHPS
jgi:hypothetical protein